MTSFTRIALLTALTTLMVSCGPLIPTAAGPRFHESAAANLVLVYYSDAAVYITKPDTRENGFLPLFSRKDIVRQLKQYDTGHNLAVVIIGRMADDEQKVLIQDWQTILRAHGFRRIVCLQAGRDNQIDGLLILHDSAMAMSDDKTGNHPTAVAPVAPAP